MNSGEEHASALATLLRLRKLEGHVNVIPYNSHSGADFQRVCFPPLPHLRHCNSLTRACAKLQPSNNTCHRFVDTLRRLGCGASIRRTRGADSAAACGQLRNEYQGRNAPAAPLREAAV